MREQVREEEREVDKEKDGRDIFGEHEGKRKIARRKAEWRRATDTSSTHVITS